MIESWRGGKNELKLPILSSSLCLDCMEGIMHNLLSFNQLAEWRHIEKSLDSLDESNEQLEQLNDYYDCLIECDESQHICKRICKEILN